MEDKKSTQVENPKKDGKQIEFRVANLEKTVEEIKKVLSIVLGQINYKE